GGVVRDGIAHGPSRVGPRGDTPGRARLPGASRGWCRPPPRNCRRSVVTSPPVRTHVRSGRGSMSTDKLATVRKLLAKAERAGPSACRATAGGSNRGVAVVPAARRRRVDWRFQSSSPRLATLRPSVLSGTGRAAGARAGQRADLGHGGGLEAGRRRALGA